MLLSSTRKNWEVGFYKVGLSWVLLLKAPKFGMIHLGSPYWWKPFRLFPYVLYFHLRYLFKKPI